jgi:hypothetical protein
MCLLIVQGANQLGRFDTYFSAQVHEHLDRRRFDIPLDLTDIASVDPGT